MFDVLIDVNQLLVPSFLLVFEAFLIVIIHCLNKFREVDVVGIFRYKNTLPLCLEFLTSGKIDVKPLITHRFGFSQKEVEEAFETSAHGGIAIKVMFNM